MIKKIGFLLLVLSMVVNTYAQTSQDLKLAQQFMRSGEYDKAKSIFSKLYQQQSANNYYYQNYFKCLLELEEYEQAEDLIKKHKKRFKKKLPLTLIADLGYLYQKQDDIEKAEQQYQMAVDKLGKENLNETRSVANTFQAYGVLNYSIKIYEKARSLDNQPMAYAYELAVAHKRDGNFIKMIDHYLEVVIVQPTREQWAKNEFQRILDNDKYRDHLETQLYRKAQQDPNETKYPELLTWYYIQQKDFESALIQVKALDKRLAENGYRVFEIAQTAMIENQYETAIDAYQYVVDKGNFNSMYQPARRALVSTKMEQIKYSNEYDDESLTSLENDYQSLLTELGRGPETIKTIRELSHLYAFYIHDLDKAIVELEKVLEMPTANKQELARCKLDLGDFYIMDNDVWEATLLYSQVDKAFKEDILGEEARFRNARLSYYNGDFTWSQAQLDVLKASTSDLISNDALELSVFIMDNLGLDTSATAMQMFARADLLIFQNDVVKATKVLDSLEIMFPGHTLSDDILFRRANIAYRSKDYTTCSNLLEEIIANYPEEILVDNALFWLAELNERQLGNTEKAMNLYEEIIVNQPGSLFIIEARKRFRILRGDDI